MRRIIDPRTIDFPPTWDGSISAIGGEDSKENNIYSAEKAKLLNGWLNEWHDGEIELFIRFLSQIHGPSLELASGAMRVMMQLALRGYEVYGLEGSPHMIEIGQRQVATLPSEVQSRIHVVQGDMRDFSLGRTFKLIMIPFHSFWYNLNETGAEQCMVTILKHLAPGGTFLIDTPLFSEKTE